MNRKNRRPKREPFAGLLFVRPRWWIDSAGNRHQVFSKRTVDKLIDLGVIRTGMYALSRHMAQKGNLLPLEKMNMISVEELEKRREERKAKCLAEGRPYFEVNMIYVKAKE